MAESFEVIKPRQSNYDTYFLPKELSDLCRSTPLYRLVSIWCLRRGGFVCRDDIASAFGISLRQASGLISSLCRKSGEVEFEIKRVKANKGNVIKSYIHITRVLDRPKRIRNITKDANLPRKVKEKHAQEKGRSLWRHLLTRVVQA